MLNIMEIMKQQNCAGFYTKTIRKWRKNEEDFKNIQNPNKKITLYKGRFKAIDYEAENKFMNGLHLTEA